LYVGNVFITNSPCPNTKRLDPASLLKVWTCACRQRVLASSHCLGVDR
jgi:hypothetical protein